MDPPDDEVGPDLGVARNAHGEPPSVGKASPVGALERVHQVAYGFREASMGRLRERQPSPRVDLPVIDVREAADRKRVQRPRAESQEVALLDHGTLSKETLELLEYRDLGLPQSLVTKVDLKPDMPKRAVAPKPAGHRSRHRPI
jgi:hypothetical protein